MNIVQKIIQTKRELTTYSIGLLQAKAYRTMKAKTDAILKPYDLSSIEWAYLGIVYEHNNGVAAHEVATLLGVEAPFVTSLSIKFESKKLIEYKKDPTDMRLKIMNLTKDGRMLVRSLEKILRKESKQWLEGLAITDILSYIKVLKHISTNPSK